MGFFASKNEYGRCLYNFYKGGVIIVTISAFTVYVTVTLILAFLTFMYVNVTVEKVNNFSLEQFWKDLKSRPFWKNCLLLLGFIMNLIFLSVIGLGLSFWNIPYVDETFVVKGIELRADALLISGIVGILGIRRLTEIVTIWKRQVLVYAVLQRITNRLSSPVKDKKEPNEEE